MILFEEDWHRYPNAIIDMQTSNKSFITLAGKYAAMGIKNNAFHLSLLDPRLQGVDPHSPDLTDDEKLWIIQECQLNPWYSIREVIRLPPQSGPNPTPYIADRSLIALFWCYYNHIDIGMVKPRQTGKSVGMDALSTQLMALECFSNNIQLITKDSQLRRINVRRLRSMIELLPPYIMPLTASDADNNEVVTVMGRGNNFETAVGQAAKERAEQMGRGLTSSTILGDEIPYVNNVHISIPVALGSATTIRGKAAAQNAPYGNVFCTTAGSRATAEGRWAYDLFQGGYNWNEKLFDCKTLEVAKDVIRKASGSSTDPTAPLFINATFNHRMLGKTDQWLLDAIANARLSPEACNRDFFNQWPSGGEGSAIDTAVLRRITAGELDPVYTEHTDRNYEIRWYYRKQDIERKLAHEVHIWSLDSSNAVGRDSNALVLLNSRTGEVAAVCTVKETLLVTYCKFLFELLMMYPTTVFSIENKSSGQAIIDTLILLLHRAGQDPFKRIFNSIFSAPENHRDQIALIGEFPLQRRSEMFYDRYKRFFGFQTTGATRTFLFNVLLNFGADRFSSVLRDRGLTSQLRGLTLKNGRVDHGSVPSGDVGDGIAEQAMGHDDIVIAWLLGLYYLTQSRNLKWYGFQQHLILSLVAEDKEDMDDDAKEDAYAREKLREDIDDIKQLLKHEKLSVRVVMLKARLAKLVQETSHDGGEALSFGAIMDEVESFKSKKK